MATKKEGASAEPAKSSTSKSRSRKDRGSGQMLVYSEVSITVNVYEQNFIKITWGHERTAASDSKHDLMKAERAAFDFNMDVVNKRARKVERLIKQIQGAADDDGD